jgi:hypothetical protein
MVGGISATYILSYLPKPFNAKAQTSFSDFQTSYVLSYVVAGRIKLIHEAPLGESNWKHAAAFSWTLPHIPFLLLFLMFDDHNYSIFSDCCKSF